MGMALGLAVCLLLGADAAEDSKALQGTWTLVSGEVSGKAMTAEEIKDGKLTIKGDTYTVEIKGREKSTGVQKLDATKKPKTLDGKSSAGADKDKTILGIYELKGDEFRISLAPPGKERPTKFTTAPDSGYWMHVWKRAK
jgi:uncharacterized protein (TIGR03067 family)